MKRKNTTRLLPQSILFLSIAVLCFSCTSQKKIDEQNQQYLYFQNNLENLKRLPLKERVIQPGDLLNIQVLSNSLNQEQTLIFNLNSSTTNANGSTVINNNSNAPSYLVDASGEIDMPVIGKVKADSLTKGQLQTNINDKISLYVKNPIVLIKFADFKVNVLGEVKTPGSQNFLRDKVTIIDAISAAGDLTDYAKREDIVVLREENGVVKHYTVDIRDGAIFKSPVYQLRPNDIVYVTANTKKMKSLKYSTYNQKGTQTFLGIASITTALIYLVSTIIRNK
jgi:polysaccharide export outer membrane protein